MIRRPETQYATTDDGVSIAYQTIGDGPPDIVLELEAWGNVETMWELDAFVDLFDRLSSFSRLILHDRRGTGLSGGSSFANLETRAQDLLTVLDTIRASEVVLFGERTSGAAFALFAATYPTRVSALVWFRGVATRRWSPEYPWGLTAEGLRQEATDTRAGMGSIALARQWIAHQASSFAGDERIEVQVARLDRHFMAPSTAAKWMEVQGETDVTAVLPLLRCPTLVFDYEQSSIGAAESRYILSRVPGAELVLVTGEPHAMPFAHTAEILEAVQAFLGRERGGDAPESVLSTVLFTDVVGSTERQAAAGDRAWSDVVRRHHALVRGSLERWHGIENDTAGDGFYATFDGPARAIRCALEIADRVADLGIEIRAGIHTGECELVDGKYAGLAVTVGSRIAALAGASEVYVSRTVKDLTAGSGFLFEDRGERELKGVPEPWRLYRVVA